MFGVFLFFHQVSLKFESKFILNIESSKGGSPIETMAF